MRVDRKILSYLRNYKFNSLLFKNMALLIALIIVPLTGAAVIAYYAYGSMQENDQRSYSEKITMDAYNDFQRILQDAQSELVYIGFNSDVELYMYDTEELRQFNYRIRTIQDLIRMPLISKDYIRSIYIYSYNNNRVISAESFSEFTSFPERDCLDAWLKYKDGESDLILTESSLNGFDEKQLSLFLPIRYGAMDSGVAVMNFDLEALNREFSIPEGDLIFLTNGEQILYSNDEEWIRKERSRIPGISHIDGDKSYFGEGYVLTTRKMPDSSAEVITSLASRDTEGELSTVKKMLLSLILIMLAITLLLSAWISVRLFRPIEVIMGAIRENKNVLIGEEELFQEKDELEYILSSIQRTANIKRDVDEELSERVRLLKKAQAVALQSQINPHFLNNTLDTINWIAVGLLGGDNKISEMTGALSQILRMTLENTDSIIPLAQEIEHCRYYIDIQNIRYEDKYEVVWEIPGELYECKTVRVILQPVLENAIYHGVKYLSGKGKINIGGKISEGIVELTVEDNGLGMSGEEIRKLRESMDSEMIKESRHIGLANVNQRIRLYFGQEYGVFLESREGFGTKVTIRFPEIREKV